MDAGITKLRHLVMLYGLHNLQPGPGHRSAYEQQQRAELRRYFAQGCDRYIGSQPVVLRGKWAAVKLGKAPENRRMAYVLQQLCQDPAAFGMERIALDEESWMVQFIDRLWRAPILGSRPSERADDRRTEYFVLCWLVCVERGSALLQRGIRKAINMEEVYYMDAFQYLAAAALLLLRNTELNWFDAITAYRETVARQRTDLPAPTQSWAGRDRSGEKSVSERLSDQDLLEGFRRLCAQPHAEENWLPALVRPEAGLLRELILLPTPKTNDYLYLMQRYLAPLIPRCRLRTCDYDTVLGLAEKLRALELAPEAAGSDGQITARMEDLIAPPPEAEDTLATPARRKSAKVPFRMLRHTLYLLLGMRQDRYYGRERDIRDLVFRLGFACGMNSRELEQLLLEQEMPGIDFKTAPELLLAYYADRCTARPAPPAGPGWIFLPLNTGAYATARLAQRIYAIRYARTPDPARASGVALEPTRYISHLYQSGRKWDMAPADFLDWLLARNIPGQDCETLLCGGRWKNKAAHLLIYCSQLFRARRALQCIDRHAAALEYARKQQALRREAEALRQRLGAGADGRFAPAPAQEKMLRSALKNAEDRLTALPALYAREQESFRRKAARMDRVLTCVNHGIALFEEPRDEALPVLDEAVALNPWREAFVSSFFPYDTEERNYTTYFLSGARKEKELRQCWNQYCRRKLAEICDCITHNRMLCRDDYLCLLFVEFLVSYPERHGQAQPTPDMACVMQFAREIQPELKESRMQGFTPQREPQMTRALLQAAQLYQKVRQAPPLP